MLETILSITLPSAISGITAYVIYKKVKKTVEIDNILDVFDALLDELGTNQEMQRKLYVVGGIVGQGIKAGVGLKGSSGKFKFQDMIGALFGMAVQKFAPGLMQQEQSEAPPSIETQNLNRNKM